MEKNAVVTFFKVMNLEGLSKPRKNVTAFDYIFSVNALCNTHLYVKMYTFCYCITITLLN